MDDRKKEEGRRRYALTKKRMEKMKEEEPEKYEQKMERTRECKRRHYQKDYARKKLKMAAMTEEERTILRTRQRGYQITYVEKLKREGGYQAWRERKRAGQVKYRQNEKARQKRRVYEANYRSKLRSDPVRSERRKTNRNVQARQKREDLKEKDPAKYQEKLERERTALRRSRAKKDAAQTLLSMHDLLHAAFILQKICEKNRMYS